MGKNVRFQGGMWPEKFHLDQILNDRLSAMISTQPYPTMPFLAHYFCADRTPHVLDISVIDHGDVQTT